MNKTGNPAIILLAVLFFIQPVLAGEIVFTAESPVIYNSGDEEVSVSLGVANSLGGDVYGSFTWTVHDRDNPGDTRSSTDGRVIFADMEQTSFMVQTSGGHEYSVDVAFDYPDSDDPDSAFHVSLDGIRVVPVSGSGSGSPVEILESVQFRLSKGALQQTGAQQNTGSVNGIDGSPLVITGDENIESVSRLLENETNNLIRKKERLLDVVNGSAVCRLIDQVLKDSGYLPGNPVVVPGSGAYEDEFEVIYSGANRSEIKVSGEIAGDEILFTKIGSQGRMPLLYGVEENATYISCDSELSGDGYSVAESTVNITGNEARIEISYGKGISGKNLEIFMLDGEIVSLELRETDDGIHFIVPFMVIVLTAVCSFLFYRIYLKCLRSPEQKDETEISCGEEDIVSPGDLLDESYDNYLCGELKGAVGKAGLALRLHAAAVSGSTDRLTNSEALMRLEMLNDPGIDSYAGVFSVCDSVVYGNRTPERSEFIGIYETAASLIDRDRESPGDQYSSTRSSD